MDPGLRRDADVEYGGAVRITEPAPAKLNLALHVRRRRADGYHDIETVFAFARDGDVVTVEKADEDSFTVTGPFMGALSPSSRSRGEGRGEGQLGLASAANCPSTDLAALGHPLPASRERESDNLVLRAVLAFAARFAIAAPHAITLDKRLPVASGIGGGSADAAATLRALARLHEIDDMPALETIARTLGADVPACLHGRPAHGTGRGDDLAALSPLGDLPVLLVNPNVAVPTAQVFAAWDGVDRGPLDLLRWREARNDLAAPATAIAPVIAEVLATLAAQPGTTLARMSGSGATCFALFEDTAARDAAGVAIKNGRHEWWCLVTTLA